MSSFIFVLCQAGAEPALKREIARLHPELRFAYSRPGFITFKQEADSPDPSFKLGSIFSRAYGYSLGKMKPEALDSLIEAARKLTLPASQKRLRLHVAEREPFEPGSEPKGYEAGARASALRKQILAAAPNLFDLNPEPQTGEMVFDVLQIEDHELWLGMHVHGPDHSPFEGGKPDIILPPQAPSRAYLKLEEAVLWSGAHLEKGQVAVEIGSAPGGASLAMLNRGLEVYGIDRAEMDPVVFHNPSFHRVGTSVFEVLRTDFPKDVHWLMMDMNAPTDVSIQAVEGMVPWFKDSLLGVILTLKLNDWNHADKIPEHLERFHALGLTGIRARQLAHNRREYTVFALTPRGSAKKGTVR